MGTPVNLLLSSQKCQGVPLSPQSDKIQYRCSGPIRVDPICLNQGKHNINKRHTTTKTNNTNINKQQKQLNTFESATEAPSSRGCSLAKSRSGVYWAPPSWGCRKSEKGYVAKGYPMVLERACVVFNYASFEFLRYPFSTSSFLLSQGCQWSDR